MFGVFGFDGFMVGFPSCMGFYEFVDGRGACAGLQVVIIVGWFVPWVLWVLDLVLTWRLVMVLGGGSQ